MFLAMAYDSWAVPAAPEFRTGLLVGIGCNSAFDAHLSRLNVVWPRNRPPFQPP